MTRVVSITNKQILDSNISKMLQLQSLELLDDIESLTDEEIDVYVSHLRQMGHEAFEMAA